MSKLVQSAHVHAPFSTSAGGDAASAGLTVEVLRRRKSSTRRRRSRPLPALYIGKSLVGMLAFSMALTEALVGTGYQTWLVDLQFLCGRCAVSAFEGLSGPRQCERAP